MPRLAVDRRAEQYRQHARELITAAWRADDVDRKRHLFNLAKSYQRVADALDPQPPAEPQVFRNIK
jgi:hypothetical protein